MIRDTIIYIIVADRFDYVRDKGYCREYWNNVEEYDGTDKWIYSHIFRIMFHEWCSVASNKSAG